MGQVRELKCPHCGEWTLWAGSIDDRCLYCDGFLEPQRFSREVEKKILKEVVKENDYLFIRPTDSDLKRQGKLFLNGVRWVFLYIQVVFFIFISIILVLISIIAA